MLDIGGSTGKTSTPALCPIATDTTLEQSSLDTPRESSGRGTREVRIYPDSNQSQLVSQVIRPVGVPLAYWTALLIDKMRKKTLINKTP
jgi:hypothetical protein